MTATARQIAVLFYHLVKNRKPYHDLGADYYVKQNWERALKRLQRQAKRFGYDLVAQPV
jgi:transposase